MLRQPPSSTLFPYTTLFPIWDRRWTRARCDPAHAGHSLSHCTGSGLARAVRARARAQALASAAAADSHAHLLQLLMRSEEHTSELQSHSDLVCRLLLEKKKKT